MSVFESATFLGEIGAGIQLGAKAVRILDSLQQAASIPHALKLYQRNRIERTSKVVLMSAIRE